MHAADEWERNIYVGIRPSSRLRPTTNAAMQAPTGRTDASQSSGDPAPQAPTGKVAEVLQHAPFVKTLTGVILQFIKIRDELETNKKRCIEIIDKVLSLSRWICDKLAVIAKSGERAKENLAQVENALTDCASTLTKILGELKKHQARPKLVKLVSRGIEDLNKLDRSVDDLEKRLLRDMVFDIKLQQGMPVSSENTDPASHPSTEGHDDILPPKPYLIVEREVQVNIALRILLSAEPSRIAILEEIAERYQSRYFLSCEAFTDADTLLLGIGSMLDIKASPTAMLASIRRRLETSGTLLCLDNFETPWSPLPLAARSKNCWHPSPTFLNCPSSSPPVTICGPDFIIDEPTQNLLDVVDGIPLAITLISNLLRDGESSRSLWNRWLKQETKIVENGGDDRESNLNASIAISVSSPRIKKDPGAIALLATLSLLPDGFPFAAIEQLGEYLVLENVAKYYITMLEFTRLSNAECYAQVVPEIQNIHLVFQRVFKVGYSQDITRLIYATSDLTDWSDYIGYLSQDTIQMALKSSVNFPIPHAKCLMSLGLLYRTEGQDTKAEICFREAAVLFKQAKDVDGEADALERSGTMLFYLGQLDQSEVVFQTSLKLYTKTGNKQGQAHAREGLGNLYRYQGQFMEAQATLSDALEAYQQTSNLIGQANVARSLSDLHFSRGNLVKAEKYATEALDTAKQANYAIGEGNALQELGRTYLALDRVPEARQALEQAHMIQRQQNDSISQLNGINDLAEVYIQSDQLSAAEALLTASSKVELDVVQIPDILTMLGWLYICGDRLDKAEPILDDALQRFQRFDDKGWQAKVLGYLGTIYLKSNRLDEAERALKSIPDLGTWIDVEIHRLWALGELYIVKGDLKDAQASLNAAMAGCKDWGEYPLSYQQGNILRSMGTLHVEQSRADLAIDKFKEAREFHRKAQWVSEQATDLKRLGEAYEMLERAEEAEAAFREAEDLMESVREARTLKE
ncbi:hypothetical protein BJ912DRAFT_1045147 [Pholiota molesta]|nr:hypothetical protein BJ912DRAFT_1045147 [Pholiota molesta]